MPLTPFIRTEKAARKVLEDTGLLIIFMWDSEWNEFAAFAKAWNPVYAAEHPRNVEADDEGEGIRP